ncbi:hypothetical protein os1_45600 [Comamonadaceae bacterium OS-1]|nr:hypothetical protein os1_45600 [Comamonadaceae bacterium OS-1]
MSSASTFIQAVELWAPSADGYLLEFQSGIFGAPAWGFANLTRSMCFGRGEGLPGRAWEEGRPILLSQLQGSLFRRSAAATSLGWTSAVAVPFFAGGTIQSVLVFFCGKAPTQAGTLELWQAQPGLDASLTLVDGAFGPGAQALEAFTRGVTLAPGAGLPGAAHHSGTAQFIDDLGAAQDGFVRAELAAAQGLVRGLAMSCGQHHGVDYVLAFLASQTLPLAQRVECWALDETGSRLQRVFAFSELNGGYSSVTASMQVPTAVSGGAIAKAWLSGLPSINDHPISEPGPPSAAASGLGATGLLAVPFLRDGQVVEVLALYL